MHSQSEVGEKRIREAAPDEGDQPHERRIRRGAPSLANFFKEAMYSQFPKILHANLEQMIRRVVNEEVTNGIMQAMQSLRSPSQMQIRPPAEVILLRLCFTKPIPSPIFSNIKIGEEENPLEISVDYTHEGNRCCPSIQLPRSVKVEILVLDGAFSPDEHGEWTPEEFERSIVKERNGKRPLIVGSTLVTIRDASPHALPDLMFTDNSSWIKNRMFRIGARVAAGSSDGPRIKEAVTEPFPVRDQRGKHYEKHFPPLLDDYVWRLKHIAKDGKFRQRLDEENILTVQDFLKLWSTQPNRLKKVLGSGMTEKMWEQMIGHANTCDKGSKLYISNRKDSILVLNSICQLEAVVIDGIEYCSPTSIADKDHKQRVERMVLEAYEQWNSLEVLDKPAMMQNGLMLQEASPSASVHGNGEVVAAVRYQDDGFRMPGPFCDGGEYFSSSNFV